MSICAEPAERSFAALFTTKSHNIRSHMKSSNGCSHFGNKYRVHIKARFLSHEKYKKDQCLKAMLFAITLFVIRQKQTVMIHFQILEKYLFGNLISVEQDKFFCCKQKTKSNNFFKRAHSQFIFTKKLPIYRKIKL